jgi:hypothetical protein
MQATQRLSQEVTRACHIMQCQIWQASGGNLLIDRQRLDGAQVRNMHAKCTALSRCVCPQLLMRPLCQKHCCDYSLCSIHLEAGWPRRRPGGVLPRVAATDADVLPIGDEFGVQHEWLAVAHQDWQGLLNVLSAAVGRCQLGDRPLVDWSTTSARPREDHGTCGHTTQERGPHPLTGRKSSMPDGLMKPFRPSAPMLSILSSTLALRAFSGLRPPH